jgi:hypothetical protein
MTVLFPQHGTAIKWSGVRKNCLILHQYFDHAQKQMLEKENKRLKKESQARLRGMERRKSSFEEGTRPPENKAGVRGFDCLNVTLRTECLNLEWFASIEDLDYKLQQWPVIYNRKRPQVPSST